MYNSLKVILDFCLALVLLLVLSWLLLGIAVILLFETAKPIFRQVRIGLKEKAFMFYKFRTLSDLSGSPSGVGRVLRRLSLDELPQIFNVLKGEMSFVGPRPLLPEYLELYSEQQKKRHLVKPGITGWAQVKGRNKLSWTEQFELDTWYVDNQSFWLDVKILAMTLVNVLRFSSDETQMREAFNGKN